MGTMSSRTRRPQGLFVLPLALAIVLPARALIFYSTGDPAHNTTAPTGPLADGGWQFQGLWQGLTGTPIAPGYFITAKHAGGGVGNVFTFQGTDHITVAAFPHPVADLTIWQVSTAFPAYAPIYTGSDEIGSLAMLFGRSPTRGEEVNVPGASPTDLRGWLWGGVGGGTLRWGQNTIDSVLTDPDNGNQYLLAGFDRGGGAEEATLASGDSGGGLFIPTAEGWKLAGIDVAVEAAFSLSADPFSPALSAIFDAGGLYADFGPPTGPQLIPDGAEDVPASLYAVRLSAYQDWINAIAPVPEPTAPLAWGGAALLALALRSAWSRRRSSGAARVAARPGLASPACPTANER